MTTAVFDALGSSTGPSTLLIDGVRGRMACPRYHDEDVYSLGLDWTADYNDDGDRPLEFTCWVSVTRIRVILHCQYQGQGQSLLQYVQQALSIDG